MVAGKIADAFLNAENAGAVKISLDAKKYFVEYS
jgi:hypothetical protein